MCCLLRKQTNQIHFPLITGDKMVWHYLHAHTLRPVIYCVMYLCILLHLSRKCIVLTIAITSKRVHSLVSYSLIFEATCAFSLM